MTAVIMRQSDWKTLEEESLMMGETGGIRETAQYPEARTVSPWRTPSGRTPKPLMFLRRLRFRLPWPPYATPGAKSRSMFSGAALPVPAEPVGGELAKSMTCYCTSKGGAVRPAEKPCRQPVRCPGQYAGQAEIILLLLSNNFLANLECLNLREQVYHHQQNRAAVVPSIFSPCRWKELDISASKPLPRNGSFITQW